MSSPVENYVAELARKYATGQARELTYRSALETFITELGVKAHSLSEPKHSEFGAPDFAFTRGDLILGYAETKDVTVNLGKIEKTEQMQRYLAGYSNLILTNYLEFRFYQNGQPYEAPIVIARIEASRILPCAENFAILTNLLRDFLEGTPEQIKSGTRLAKIMGGKARRIRDNVRHSLSDKANPDTDLQRVYESVKKMLVHDLTPEAFADMYAQTLVYGLFVARYYDESKDETFSRAKARDLVPESNPFLRQFFNHIAGADFNKRLRSIVDELCLVFAHADVHELMDEYFKRNGAAEGQDPVIHFYEDFLREYDAALRKKMGAYYTPLPVVRFIVRAVDHILKSEFGLAQGLADTSKLPNGLHRVQVLDPAVGTGTFISTVIRLIYERLREEGQKGRWPAYVHHDLLPRIHGFELMMAAYTIAHLKLSIAFEKTGFTIFHNRLGIYLTNSLEQSETSPDLFGFGFAQSIAEEAKQAAVIKNETPIMVVVGNPPYSAVSSNETPYANKLVAKYKVEPGGHTKLQERKHWLNDDYVKFIAFAEDMIGKNGDGIVAMITNNGYLDNPTFRGMRWHLCETFDKIFVLDLHGNVKKRDAAPDGSKDENVFDIQQGVGIMIAVRAGNERPHKPAKVFHAEMFGSRKEKFSKLESEPDWRQLELDSKMLYFVPKNRAGSGEYAAGFSVDELFTENVTGIVTMGDSFAIAEDKEELDQRIQKLAAGDYDEHSLNSEFGLGKNYAKWILGNQRKIHFDKANLVRINYRPFDERWTYFDNKIIWRWREKVMRYFMSHKNIGLLIKRQGKQDFSYIFVTNQIAESCMFESAYANNTVCPLYLYAEDGSQVANLKKETVREIEAMVGKATPEDIFDYIYAVLHSPSYREKYKEFLKIDFPRVPYPKDKKQFAALAALGRELRELHLLESPTVKKFITSYPEDGSNVVEKISYKDGNVYINKKQFFGGVPEVAWNFYIGGYQPAQKWLKDRKGRTLTNDDIEHYQKIIVALAETYRIMNEIDKVPPS